MDEKKENPLVTVMVSCYNHEDFIDDCMESLCRQTYPRIEVLITDDSSSDSSYSRLKSWEKKLQQRFERVTIKRNEVNRGLVRNLNSMIRDAKGEYIKDLASDDFLPENAIGDLVTFALSSDADVVFSNSYIVDEDDRLDSLHTPLATYYRPGHPPRHGRNLTSALCAHNHICAPAALVPKRTYLRYGLYKENLSFEDAEFWLRVSVTGSIEYLDRITSYYRIRKQSFCHFTSDEEDFRREINFYRERVSIQELYSRFCTKKEWKISLNNEIAVSMSNMNGPLTDEILSDMHRKRVRLTPVNLMKVFLFRNDAYGKVRAIKRKILRKNRKGQ